MGLHLISVIIPIYNVEKYLFECIDSVLRQTYKNLEIILVDDGSTDRSGQICDDYKLKDKRIIVIHKTNGGLSSARNTGVDIATGDYVTYIDSDDYVADDMIELLYNAMLKMDSDISCCYSTRLAEELGTGTGNIVKYSTDKSLIEMFYDRSILASACAKLYKRDLAQAVKFEDGRIYEDYLFSVNITVKSNSITSIDKALYYYRVNNSSITQVTFSPKNFDILHAATQVEEIIKNYNAQLLKYAYIRRVHLALNLYVQCCLADMLGEYGKRIRNEIKSHFFLFIVSRKSFKRKILATMILICPNFAKNIIKKRY